MKIKQKVKQLFIPKSKLKIQELEESLKSSLESCKEKEEAYQKKVQGYEQASEQAIEFVKGLSPKSLEEHHGELEGLISGLESKGSSTLELKELYLGLPKSMKIMKEKIKGKLKEYISVQSYLKITDYISLIAKKEPEKAEELFYSAKQHAVKILYGKPSSSCSFADEVADKAKEAGAYELAYEIYTLHWPECSHKIGEGYPGVLGSVPGLEDLMEEIEHKAEKHTKAILEGWAVGSWKLECVYQEVKKLKKEKELEKAGVYKSLEKLEKQPKIEPSKKISAMIQEQAYQTHLEELAGVGG